MRGFLSRFFRHLNPWHKPNVEERRELSLDANKKMQLIVAKQAIELANDMMSDSRREISKASEILKDLIEKAEAA